MLKSMTGYGKADHLSDDLNIIVEIKTLNSKNLDIMIKVPKTFSEKEMAIRGIIEKQLERGKVVVTIDYQDRTSNNQTQVINDVLFKTYYKKLEALSKEVSANSDDLFRLALYLPDVIVPEISPEADGTNWNLLKTMIEEAVSQCNAFRVQEGMKLSDELQHYILSVDEQLARVDELDPERIEHIKTRIRNNLEELRGDIEYDQNRFEQELIYYLEKLDISEEKVRLKSHLDYFLSEIKSDRSNGKKLSFISQEIGREINTIGSKANFVPITRYVILMKENLEKIKEQLLNIL